MDKPDANTLFAAERTLLAWIRTVLALIGFGFVIAKFGAWFREMAKLQGVPPPPESHVSLLVGVALIVAGVLVSVFSAIRHHRNVARILAREAVTPDRVGPIVAVVLAVFGIAMAAYLFFDLR